LIDSSIMDLSVVIVSYNTKALTLNCIETLYRESSDMELQVIVVDNNSHDGSKTAISENFPDVILIALDENIGFARANNLAVRRAQSEWILLLNPDTQVQADSIKKMLKFSQHQHQPCIVGGRVYRKNGHLDPGSCWGEPTLWSTFCASVGLSALFSQNLLFDPESLGSWQRDTVREVDIIAGCLLLIPIELWHQLDGFDSRFFMYSEDVDLSIRARKAGARLIICPDAKIMHHAGASEVTLSSKTIKLFYAKVQFFNKHWPKWKAILGAQLLVMHAIIRTLGFGALGILNADYRQSYEQWFKVWQKRSFWKKPGASFDEIRSI